MTARDLIKLCRACAAQVYGERPPSIAYAASTAMLLAGTAAHESDGLKARRQYGLSYTQALGGWGLWQTERAVLIDTRRYLSVHPAVLRRATTFITQDPRADVGWLLEMYDTPTTLLRWIACHDRLAVAQARLHYFQRPGAIPPTIQGQAEYWKQHYNTNLGKGTMRQYVNTWDRIMAPAWHEH